MRVLVLSDIHANLDALDAVLADANSGTGYDRCWVLGDTVGYGPQPNECLSRVADLGAVIVAGNHDLVAVGAAPAEEFNRFVRSTAHWTSEQLSPSSIAQIVAMPLTVVEGDFTLVHGSPRDTAWEYLATVEQGIANLDHFFTRGCVMGHTHRQMVMQFDDTGRLLESADGSLTTVALTGHRFYVNPGSVGQPRDGDSRAAYALIDTDAMTVEFRRCRYNFGRTQQLMREARFPGSLIRQLESGRGRSLLQRLTSVRGRRLLHRFKSGARRVSL